MAVTAADGGIFHVGEVLAAPGFHFYAAAKSQKAFAGRAVEGYIGASVLTQNIGDRAGMAVFCFPGQGIRVVFEQATFFNVTASVVVAIKVFTFFTGGSKHSKKKDEG